MKETNLPRILALLCLASTCSIQAQTTTFTYQGALKESGTNTSGIYDVRFSIYANAGGGSPLGSPITNPSVGVTNGLFTVSLDFGSGIFTGSSRWLEMAVRTNGSGGSYTVLGPRQSLTAAPYAMYAPNAGAAASATTASGLSLPFSGTLSSPNSVFTLTNSGSGPAGVFFGKVGVGTTTPDHPLTVQSPVGGTTPITWRNPTFELGALSWNPDPNSGWLGLYSSGNPRVSIGANGSSYFNGGNVGIGTTSPSALLYEAKSGGQSVVKVESDGSGALMLLSRYNSGSFFYLETGASGNDNLAIHHGVAPYADLVVSPSGNVGIGTTSPGAPLQISGTQAYERIASSSTLNGSVLELWNTTPQPIDAPPVTLGAINFGNGNTTPGQIAYIVNQTSHAMSFRVNGTERMSVLGDGTVSVGVLQINGADLAEPFEISTKEIPKGSVVTIDQEHPGQLKLSERAYDKKVAGILSGANGVHPGIRLKQEGFNDQGEEVALSGRVYALSDASEEPIEPGDLLTTSSTPGHCMKATDTAKSHGAIIGKAMSSLKSGKGLVLVLVSLQ
jgi:hypothetical protein